MLFERKELSLAIAMIRIQIINKNISINGTIQFTIVGSIDVLVAFTILFSIGKGSNIS